MFAYVCPVRTTRLYRVHRLTEDWLNCEQAALVRSVVAPPSVRGASVGLLFRAAPCGTRCRSGACGAVRWMLLCSSVLRYLVCSAQQFERRPRGRPVTFTVTPGVVRLRYIPPLVRRSLTSSTDVTRAVAPVTVCLWALFIHIHTVTIWLYLLCELRMLAGFSSASMFHSCGWSLLSSHLRLPCL